MRGWVPGLKSGVETAISTEAVGTEMKVSG